MRPVEKVDALPTSFRWDALTESEQRIFSILYRSAHAMNAFEIYIEMMLIELKKSGNDVYEIQGQRKNITALRTEARRDAIKAIGEFKKKKMKFISYPTVVRFIERMERRGWLKKRDEGLGAPATVYYLGDEVNRWLSGKEKIEKTEQRITEKKQKEAERERKSSPMYKMLKNLNPFFD